MPYLGILSNVLIPPRHNLHDMMPTSGKTLLSESSGTMEQYATDGMETLDPSPKH